MNVWSETNARSFRPGRRLLKNSQPKNIKKHNLGVDFLKLVCYNYIVIKRKETKQMEKIIIIDTETTNSIDDALTYDIGFIVADYNGKIYSKHSFVVADIFCDKELMSSAFFADKIPTYWKEIKNGSRTLTTFRNVMWTIRHIMRENNIKKVYAYNCRFDYCSLATTQRFITSSKYRFFFPYGTEFHDILALSRNVLKKNKNYRQFCKKNNYLTQNNANRYTAEIVARYFFDNEFVEEHTALSDCEIEYKILLECEKLDGFNFETKMWQKGVNNG